MVPSLDDRHHSFYPSTFRALKHFSCTIVSYFCPHMLRFLCNYVFLSISTLYFSFFIPNWGRFSDIVQLTRREKFMKQNKSIKIFAFKFFIYAIGLQYFGAFMGTSNHRIQQQNNQLTCIFFPDK